MNQAHAPDKFISSKNGSRRKRHDGNGANQIIHPPEQSKSLDEII